LKDELVSLDVEVVSEEELVESTVLVEDRRGLLESNVDVLELEPNGAQAERTNARKRDSMDMSGLWVCSFFIAWSPIP